MIVFKRFSNISRGILIYPFTLFRSQTTQVNALTKQLVFSFRLGYSTSNQQRCPSDLKVGGNATLQTLKTSETCEYMSILRGWQVAYKCI